MNVELGERVMEIPESKLDLPLGKYLELAKLIESIPKENVEEYFQTTEGILTYLDIVEIFIGESADDLTLEDLNKVGSKVVDLILLNEVDDLPSNKLVIGGVTYMTRNISQLSDIGTGEYISLKTYQERFNNNLYEYAPYALAILVRPAVEERDNETGEIKFKMDKFNKNDIENLEWRANEFKKVPAKLLLPVLNFFLNGKD